MKPEHVTFVNDESDITSDMLHNFRCIVIGPADQDRVKSLVTKTKKLVVKPDKIRECLEKIFIEPEYVDKLCLYSLDDHCLGRCEDLDLLEHKYYAPLFLDDESDPSVHAYVKSMFNASHLKGFGPKFKDVSIYQVCTNRAYCLQLYPKIHKSSFEALYKKP